ncbi:UDP-glucuronosyl/UDP-glucosyltransferase [Corchorus capsularis]|uniref:UDP-glucuronosyl/UDP-glucosyltransferase n=1 Tax=Corchorus capsularis TaxID=210143 RepID=A0A1R3HDQ9_COCAP|nr:UDP-glucuronosyl/UDP-glucosyltransferase [Corchorus capsularis]
MPLFNYWRWFFLIATSLATILFINPSAAKSRPLVTYADINTICSKTEDQPFCFRVLTNQTFRPYETNLLGLAKIPINLALSGAFYINEDIPPLLKQAKNYKEREAYTLCSQNYNEAYDTVRKAIRFLTKDDYRGLRVAALSGGEEAKACGNNNCSTQPSCLDPEKIELLHFKMEQKKSHGVIALFPIPYQGHINPMLQLANILHDKGFSITIIHTCFNSPNPSKYPHFRFLSISDGLPEDQVVPSGNSDVLALTNALNLNCVTPFRDCFQELLSSNDDDPIVCLITDGIWHFTQAVANDIKVPRIVLWTSSATVYLNFIPNPIPHDYERGDIVQENDLESALQFVASVFRETKASSGLILNTCEDLEQEAIEKCSMGFSIPIFTIGPFHKYFSASSSSLLPQDQSCITWLDKQAPNSVIYVSIGSLAAMAAKTEFLEIAWGLANSKQPFLWVVRPGSVPGSEWLEPLPEGFLEMVSERGHLVKWAPQQQVLAHPATGGFWTHCGWNSTLESLSEGVPMICQPFFADQGTDATLITDVWKVGVRLADKIERGEIEKTIKRLMVEEQGQEMRGRIMLLKEKISLCLQPGGSSYKSLDNLVTYISSL